jgi:hypothetical protein
LRRGQVWISDLTISILLFSLASIMAFAILMNTLDSGKDFQSTTDDAARIGNYLLSDGIPETWNQTLVVRPGILSYDRVNSSKTMALMEISNTSYASLKAMMQTQNDFIVTLENKSGNIVVFGPYCTIGNSSDVVEKQMNGTLTCQNTNFSSIDYDNLARLNRFTTYNGQIIKMNIYVWN